MLVQLALPCGQVAMGVLTVHQWSDRARGLTEMSRPRAALLFSSSAICAPSRPGGRTTARNRLMTTALSFSRAPSARIQAASSTKPMPAEQLNRTGRHETRHQQRAHASQLTSPERGFPSRQVPVRSPRAAADPSADDGESRQLLVRVRTWPRTLATKRHNDQFGTQRKLSSDGGAADHNGGDGRLGGRR